MSARLTELSIPDSFEIDGSAVARRLEEGDIPTVAPAFRDGVKRRYLRYGGERVDATAFSLLADE